MERERKREREVWWEEDRDETVGQTTCRDKKRRRSY